MSLEAVHRARPGWPIAVALLALAAIGVGVYGMQYEARRHSAFHDGFDTDFQVAAGIAFGGLVLFVLPAWGWLAVAKLDFDRAAAALLVRPRGSAPQTVRLEGVRAIAIVPLRTFVFDVQTHALLRVDREDALCAATADGPVELARGAFEKLRDVGSRLAALPGARFGAPTAAIEPAEHLDAALRGRLTRVLETPLAEEYAREIRTVLAATKGVPDEATRLLAEHAMQRHERRHGKRVG